MESTLLISVVVILIITFSSAQDVIFPGLEENDRPGKIPPRLSDDRIPLLIPGRCPPNQLLYPGDQKHDWICDCGPGFIYYPPRDGCFAPYRKGPCSNNEYLVLPKQKVVPECIENPCKSDGLVRYQSKCYELNKPGGPCKPSNEGGGVFGVNTTTLELQCLQGDMDPLSLIHVPANCPPGSKRGASHCRPEYRRK